MESSQACKTLNPDARKVAENQSAGGSTKSILIHSTFQNTLQGFRMTDDREVLAYDISRKDLGHSNLTVS